MFDYVMRYHYITWGEPKNIWEVPYARYLEHLQYVNKKGLNVWITFDDGWDMGTATYAVYKEARRIAPFVTVFLVSSLIGRAGKDADSSLVTRSLSFMNQKTIRTLSDMGVGLGSHGRTHKDFTSFTGDALREELLFSKVELESMFHQPIYVLAYPSGYYNDEIQKVANDVGYLKAVACEDGDQSDFGISRIGMYNKSFEECIDEFNNGERGRKRK